MYYDDLVGDMTSKGQLATNFRGISGEVEKHYPVFSFEKCTFLVYFWLLLPNFTIAGLGFEKFDINYNSSKPHSSESKYFKHIF